MAVITFPSSPTLNQTYTIGSKTWVWNGYAWDLQTSIVATSDTFARNQANAAYTRANNSVNANTGGTISGSIIVAGNVTSNIFFANTYIQFGDGSKQYTANAGSGGGGGTSANGFGVIYTANNNTYANAATANAQLNFVGESGVYVYANATTKTITVAGTPGAQGMTVDYGYVYDPTYYAVDYGTL